MTDDAKEKEEERKLRAAEDAADEETARAVEEHAAKEEARRDAEDAKTSQEEDARAATELDPYDLDSDAPLPPPVEKVRSFVASFVVMMLCLLGIELAFRDSPVDKAIRKSYHHVMKMEAYRKMGGDIVVTGSSRMFHAAIPHTMTQVLEETTGHHYSVFNLGIPAGRMPAFQMMANEAARHERRPRLFIIGVDPVLWSCCETVSASHVAPMITPSAIPWLIRATWWAYPEEAGSAIAMGLSRALAERTDTLEAYKTMVLPGPPLNFEGLSYGWISQGGRTTAAVQEARAKGRTVAYGKLMDKSLGAKVFDVNLEYLKWGIRELKRAGIRVLVVGTPQARQLDANHDAAHTYAEAMAAVRKVTDETKTPFHDFNDFPGLENIDFVDGDHMSEPGAQKFTQIMTRTAVAPLLQ